MSTIKVTVITTPAETRSGVLTSTSVYSRQFSSPNSRPDAPNHHSLMLQSSVTVQCKLKLHPLMPAGMPLRLSHLLGTVSKPLPCFIDRDNTVRLSCCTL